MFIFVLPNYHIILLPKTKFAEQQAWFSFCKKKSKHKNPKYSFQAWINTASYCGSKLMRKNKSEMALRYILTFDCHDFFNPASQICSSKNKKNNILYNSAKSKVLPSKSYLPIKLLSSTRKSQFMKRKSLPLSTLSSQFWIKQKREFEWH